MGLATVISPVSELITVDYSVRLGIIPIAPPGSQASLTNYRIVGDHNSTSSVQIDPSHIVRTCPVEPDEVEIDGYEAVRRINYNGNWSLDFRVMETFLRNQSRIPDKFREAPTFFSGLILEGKLEKRFLPCLVFNGSWFTWYCRDLRLPFQHKAFFAQLRGEGEVLHP